MTVQQEKELSPADAFAVHAYNAVFTGHVRNMPRSLQDEMFIAVVDHLISQLRPDARKKFLDHVRQRIDVS